MVIFVGDKPSKNSDPLNAFKGAACEARLMQWIEQLGVNYTLINRVDACFERYKSWALEDNIPIIALGNEASKALGHVPHFKLPHPSGRNRQLNNPEFVALKLQAAKEYLKR